MLSFDITDKTIRIVKGYQSGGKIKVSDAVTIDIEENNIENGKISDVPGLAAKIGDILKSRNIKEKDAVVSLSSNQTIFKELSIPKAKPKQFLKMVRAEMQAQLGIDETYSISYIIVDEYKENIENDKKAKNVAIVEKILATACPYEMIDNCKQLFSFLSISLKSVMIGCNCISKVILSDVKSCLKMPLLTVQINKNFLSMNLYDDLKLAFSRVIDVDPLDYSNAPDYMCQAINDNIFRMLQFQKTRNAEQSIENVMFYGDLTNAQDIMETVENMELNVSKISVPPQVSGCENLDFSVYANAVGALFKRNKNIERINLLETDTIHKNKFSSNTSYSMILTGILGAAVLAVGGVWMGLNVKYNMVADDLSSIESKINSPDTVKKQKMFDILSAQEEKINEYRNSISIAADAFKTHPSISQEYINII